MSKESTRTPEQWNERYHVGDTPWDSGIRSAELARVLKNEAINPARAVELGCGTGTNAIFLAQQGFDVTGIDCSPLALQQAGLKAEQAGVNVRFIAGDVCALPEDLGVFGFVFDRGCYHCVRRDNLSGFLNTLRQITEPGSKYLLLAGSANEQSDLGIPKVHEHEIRAELGELFDVHWMREFRFEDSGGAAGPLGWSCWMSRRKT